MNYIICNWNNVADIVHANEIQSKKKKNVLMKMSQR